MARGKADACACACALSLCVCVCVVRVRCACALCVCVVRVSCACALCVVRCACACASPPCSSTHRPPARPPAARAPVLASRRAPPVELSPVAPYHPARASHHAQGPPPTSTGGRRAGADPGRPPGHSCGSSRSCPPVCPPGCLPCGRTPCPPCRPHRAAARGHDRDHDGEQRPRGRRKTPGNSHHRLCVVCCCVLLCVVVCCWLSLCVL